jgi:predicted TIM-barrel fold metal-dependent hydrolase
MARRLITSDCHIAPPHSLVEQLPKKYREHFPRLERRDDGTYLKIPANPELMMGMRLPPEMKLDDTPSSLARAAVGNVCEESSPSFDAAEQLADLERDGVYGAVLIGRISIRDNLPPDVDAAYCEIVNDWIADTWKDHLDRVAPGIYLPYRDVALSVKELERCAAMGMRPALLPDGIWDAPYFLPEWEPLWEAANALKMPLTLHVGGMRSAPRVSPPPSFSGTAVVGWYNQCCGMGETLGWLVFSGVLQRYPDLHFIMTEGYAAWLAFAMQFFDHHTVDSRYASVSERWPGPRATLDAPPSYYLKRQAHATFMWDPMAIANRHLTGLDCLLWGNDYPHIEGSFPWSQEWVDKQFAGVPEDEIDQMVRGNTARIFNIDIS